jgi:hypothetical protein
MGRVKKPLVVLLIISVTLTLFVPMLYAAPVQSEPLAADYHSTMTALQLGGSFAEIVAIAIDPALVLAVFSVIGYLGRNDIIPLGDSAFAMRLMSLPVSDFGMMIFFLVIAAVKIVLSITRGTELINKAFLSKPEFCLAVLSVCGSSFTSVFAAPAAAAGNDSANVAVLALIAIVSAVGGFLILHVIGTMMKGADAAAFIFALIPGTFQFIQLGKAGTTVGFVLLAIFAPWAAAVTGAAVLLIAVLTYGLTYRLQRYFSHIYISPLLNTVYTFLFKKSKDFPLVMKKVPSYISENFPNMRFCHEAFVLHGIPGIPAREMMYLIQDEAGVNHLCRRKHPLKWEEVEFDPESLYGAPQFRFLMLYSDEVFKKSKVKIVLRRELNTCFDSIRVMLRFTESPLYTAKMQKKLQKSNNLTEVHK